MGLATPVFHGDAEERATMAADIPAELVRVTLEGLADELVAIGERLPVLLVGQLTPVSADVSPVIAGGKVVWE